MVKNVLLCRQRGKQQQGSPGTREAKEELAITHEFVGVLSFLLLNVKNSKEQGEIMVFTKKGRQRSSVSGGENTASWMQELWDTH